MQLEQNRGWIEDAAQRLAGRRIAIAIVQAEPSDSTQQEGGSRAAKGASATAEPAAAPKRDLKAEAMSSSAVQAMLDVFPAEIRDVEEM